MAVVVEPVESGLPGDGRRAPRSERPGANDSTAEFHEGSTNTRFLKGDWRSDYHTGGMVDPQAGMLTTGAACKIMLRYLGKRSKPR